MPSFAGFWMEIIQDWIWEWEPDGDFSCFLYSSCLLWMYVSHKSERSNGNSEEISLKLQEGESVLRCTKGGGGVVVVVGWCIPEEAEE